MTYLDLIHNADYKLSHNQITFGEYDKMIEPLRTEIPKKGKWIRVVDKAGHWVWECDCKWQQRIATNFCPDCGAKMSGGGEE